MRIILCLILFVAGCANRRVSMANYLIEAQTEFPWKLEFCTDVDIFRMHEASGAAAMWITVEYPKLYGNRKLVLFIEDYYSEVLLSHLSVPFPFRLSNASAAGRLST